MPTMRRSNAGEWHGGLVKLIAIVLVIFLLIGPGIRCAQQLPELAGQAAGQIFAGIGNAVGSAIGGFLSGLWDQVKCKIPLVDKVCAAEEAVDTSGSLMSAALDRKPLYECLIQRSKKADPRACEGFTACGPADLRMQDAATPSAWMSCMDNQARISLSRSDIVGGFDGCKSKAAGEKLMTGLFVNPAAVRFRAFCLARRRQLDLARKLTPDSMWNSTTATMRRLAASCARQPDWPKGCGSEPAIIGNDSVRTDKNYTACVWQFLPTAYAEYPGLGWNSCNDLKADTQRYVQCIKIKLKQAGKGTQVLACDNVSE